MKRFWFLNWSFIEWNRGLFSKGHVSDTEISFSPFSLSNFIQAFVSWLCRSSESISLCIWISFHPISIGTIIIFFNKVIIFRITYNSNKTRTHKKTCLLMVTSIPHLSQIPNQRWRPSFFTKKWYSVHFFHVRILFSFFSNAGMTIFGGKIQAIIMKFLFDVWFCSVFILQSCLCSIHSIVNLAYLSLYFVQTKKNVD